ncbi:hypothetical protein NDU88_004466 [Pleurodeles waltl]|uniref:Uncharacterized protein n=1 Tax=Pleurodeles waltl TaxID=8319 RepID=A0AAV7RFT3_PLEWA|nr:hypothetical protein NDU88_004466 [Pleurodeles waltl]
MRACVRARVRGQEQPVLRSEKPIIARGRASQANSRSHSTVPIDATLTLWRNQPENIQKEYGMRAYFGLGIIRIYQEL